MNLKTYGEMVYTGGRATQKMLTLSLYRQIQAQTLRAAAIEMALLWQNNLEYGNLKKHAEAGAAILAAAAAELDPKPPMDKRKTC